VIESALLMASHTVSGYGLVVTTKGCVGIGTSNPTGSFPLSKTLAISDTTNDAVLELWGNSGGKAAIQSIGGSTFLGSLAGTGYTFLTYGNNTTGITIADTGNVGFGTTSPQENLHCAGSMIIDGYMMIDYNTTSLDTQGVWLYYGDGTNPRAGNYYFDIAGGAFRVVKSTVVCAYISAASVASWNAPCSKTLKQDIKELTETDYEMLRNQLKELPLYFYHRKDMPQSPEVGYIAEETPEIAGSDGKGISYMKSIGFLASILKGQEILSKKHELTIQNQEIRLKELETQIQELELQYINEK
jgi:hypothetical protein